MLIKLLQKTALVTGILSTATVSLAHPLLSSSGLQISLEFPPPPDRPGLESSAGGGTRSGSEGLASGCTQGEIPLTALAPVGSEAETTVSARPDFFLYIPATTATAAEFVLIDQMGNDVYTNDLEIPNAPGILQVALPDNITLEEGETYTWQMAVICDPNNPSGDEYVEGKIERIPLSDELKTQVEATNEPLKQAELYAQQRIWQDTLMLMAQVRDSNPTAWTQLLESVGLEAIASVPVIQDY